MPSQSPHPDTTAVLHSVRTAQKLRCSGTSQLLLPKRCDAVLAGKLDSFQAGSSVACTNPVQHSAAPSWLNNFAVADINQHMSATLSTTQRLSMITSTAIPGTTSPCIAAPGRTSQADSTPRVVCSITSGIARTPTPLHGIENLSTPFPNSEPHMTIPNPPTTQATEQHQRQKQWQLQLLTVSTPSSVVSGCRIIHRIGYLDMTLLDCATGRLMELNMWNRKLFKSVSNLEMVSYATLCAANPLADTPHWQIIEKVWNTAMQQNIVRSIAFETRTKDIMTEVRWSNVPHWTLNGQTGTRFEHRSTKSNPIVLTHQGSILLIVIISTPLNPTQSLLNSLIPFWQTMSSLFLWQSIWKVVYAVQMQCRECRKRLTNSEDLLYFLAQVLPGCIYIQFYHWQNIPGQYADALYNSKIDDREEHIPAPLIIFSCTLLRQHLLEGQKKEVFIRTLPSQCWKWTDLIARTTSMTRMTVARMHPVRLRQVSRCQPHLAWQIHIQSWWISGTHTRSATNREWIITLLLYSRARSNRQRIQCLPRSPARKQHVLTMQFFFTMWPLGWHLRSPTLESIDQISQ